MLVPAKVAAFLRKGGYKIVLEPVHEGPDSETMSLPSAEVQQNSKKPEAVTEQDMNAQSNETNNSETETEEGECSESETDSSRAKKGGLGSAHKGGKIGKYSLWLRMSFATAVRESEMSVKDACTKFKAPRRRAREWLNEYNKGF